MEGNVTVRMCPVCGSTHLLGQVVCTAFQDQDGSWKLAPLNEDDLRFEFDNVNVEIRCGNDMCGAPYGPDGMEIELKEGENLFDYWLKHAPEAQGLPASITPEDLKKEEYEAWKAWMEEIYYHPWEGTVGDTAVLS